MYIATDRLVMVGVVSRSFEISERAATTCQFTSSLAKHGEKGNAR